MIKLLTLIAVISSIVNANGWFIVPKSTIGFCWCLVILYIIVYGYGAGASIVERAFEKINVKF